jgi:hypothetical protein
MLTLNAKANRFFHQLSRRDTAESVMFARQLEHVKAKVFDILYPELKSRMMVPVQSDAPAGARTITDTTFDRVGRAKVGAPGAVDAPRIDVFGVQDSRPVRLVTCSVGWHIMDIWSAQMAGVALDSKKLAAARKAFEFEIDEIAAIGSPDNGIPSGIINDASVTIDPATGVWSGLTAEQIVQDISDMYIGMKADTRGIGTPDTLAIPEAQHADISTRQRSTASDATILDYILKNFSWLKAVVPWDLLDTAGAGGVDRGILYKRDEDVVTQDIPVEFMTLPVYQKGQNFEIECLGTTAGTKIHQSGMVRYIDGI